MTKKIWMLCVLAVFALSTSAQSIIGKWASEPQKEDEGIMTYIFDFQDKKNVELGVECDMSDEDMSLAFELFAKGTYKHDGNKISFVLDKKDMKFNIKKMKFGGENAELFKDNPELEEGLRKMVMKIVDEEKENILESLPTNNEMTIVELTKNTLKVSDEEIVLDLKRVN